MAGRGLLLALLIGCAKDPNAPDLLDTGWFPPEPVDTDGGGLCEATLRGTTPAEGATGWYWRRPLRLEVEDPDLSQYAVRLLDDRGQELPASLVAAGPSGLLVDVVVEGGLRPATAHLLEVTDCAGVQQVRFTTSDLGLPLADGAFALRHRTYELLLSDPSAEWIQPGGLGTILSTFFSTPILLGVQWVDDNSLDWIGATGFYDAGRTWQDRAYPTWRFPLSDFSEQPFFRTEADEVALVVSGYPLPIHDFLLEGTFAADGASFGGARLLGLGDTRDTGGAIGQPNNPSAMCNLASGIGVPCEPCPDGEVFCLRVEIDNLTGREVPDLTLDVVAD